MCGIQTGNGNERLKMPSHVMPGVYATKSPDCLFAVECGRLATDHQGNAIASVTWSRVRMIIMNFEEPGFDEPLVRSKVNGTKHSESVFYLIPEQCVGGGGRWEGELISGRGRSVLDW